MPLFSVVIITYNRADLLADAIDSVLAQRWEGEFELVVVDDGSTDHTSEVLERYSGRLRSVRQENGGEGAARNRGIQEAQGRYVVWLDSDDLMPAWTLATNARVLEEAGEPTVVGAAVQSFTDVSEFDALTEEPLRFERAEDYFGGAHALDWHYGVTTSVVRRDRLVAVGGIEAVRANATDSDCMFRLGVEPGFTLVRAPVTFAYRQHAGSIMLNPEMAYRGARLMLDREHAGGYPGGRSRRRERLGLILPRIRGTAVVCVQGRRRRYGWSLYLRTFRDHLREGAFRFLIGYPLLALHPRPGAVRTARGGM